MRFVTMPNGDAFREDIVLGVEYQPPNKPQTGGVVAYGDRVLVTLTTGVRVYRFDNKEAAIKARDEVMAQLIRPKEDKS